MSRPPSSGNGGGSPDPLKRPFTHVLIVTAFGADEERVELKLYCWEQPLPQWVERYWQVAHEMFAKLADAAPSMTMATVRAYDEEQDASDD